MENHSMTGSASPEIDSIDCEILAELQENARIAFAELGRRVGLSTPAVIERVHRLEEKQVIVGYRTLVDPAKVGLPVRAFALPPQRSNRSPRTPVFFSTPFFSGWVRSPASFNAATFVST